MTQPPCWSDIELGKIIKPDAEEIVDHVFRLVHCPTELKVADTADGQRISLPPEKVLERFLDPARDYVQGVVLGESGTGKSHFIQWLRLHINEDPATILLTIPKSGTSLRGIVQRLIDRLPGEERLVYQEKLAEAGTNAATHAAKVSKFLDSLAYTIQTSDLASDAAEIDLAELLPDVLRDPNFRKGFFLQPGSTVDFIVQHVFVDPAKRESIQERREFQLGDLPLDGSHYGNASRLAKDAIDYIKGESGMEARAIALMNRNLNAAIGQTLNFTADNLIELMNALRRHLAVNGKRLILLIEDFARLQGIDAALLQALITPPGQGEERLCEIRWAMAVTTGYFEPMAQTIRTRTTFVVDMDQSRPTDISRLAAGYLNALRFGESALKELPPPSAQEERPSFCSTCNLRESCFSAFGECDGIGLFPFTERAIEVMSRRSESLTEAGRFKPRLFMQSVLETVLKHEFGTLKRGEFPSEELLARIGGANLITPIDRQRLENQDKSHSSRRIALLELWSGIGKVVDLHEGIHQAFGIPKLQLPMEELENVGKPDNPPPTEPIRPLLPSDIETLRRWANDKTMLPQSLANDLRQLLFAALEEFIDWDGLGFRKSMVASATSGPFRRASINFSRQQTQRLSSLVMLDIDESHVVSLEALLMHKNHGGWVFQDSGAYLANFLESLRAWSEEVKKKLITAYFNYRDWNPAQAAAELLLISIMQSSKVKVGDSQLETVVMRLWEESAPSPLRCLHPPMADLNAALARKWPDLLTLLRNLCSGTKGGVVGNFVRVTPVLRAVRSLRLRSFQLSQKPPAELPTKELRDLAELYRMVKERFLVHLEEERKKWLMWLSVTEDRIGAETSLTTLTDDLRQTLDALFTSGINCGPSRRSLTDIIDSIKPQTLDRALQHIRALRESNATDTIIRIASIGEARGMIDSLLKTSESFLEIAEAAVTNRRSSLETAGGGGLKESERRIEESLISLRNSLDLLDQVIGARR